MSKLIKLLLALLFAFQGYSLIAQPYNIGYSDLTYIDPARANRSIPVRVYYPSTGTGVNAPLASGEFPVVVYGHGFQINYLDYTWLSNSMVPDGFIFVFPNTETSFSPNHTTFGLDLSFLCSKMIAEGSNSSSIFYNHINARTAIMGHSMGAKAAVIGAAQGNADITALCNMAAAEGSTGTGSMLSSAASVDIPSLIIGGSEDCVAPVADNAIPLYNNLSASYKGYYEIIGASHCNFVNSGGGSACFLGEGFTCLGWGPFLSNADQHTRTSEIVIPWLKYWLMEDCNEWTNYHTELISDSGHTHQESGSLAPVSASISSTATSFCANTSATLTATITGIGCGGEWYNNSNPTGVQDINYTVNASGSYTYIAYNAAGQPATSNVIALTAITPVVPALTPLPIMCDQDNAMQLNTTQSGITGNWSGPGVSNNSFNPVGLSGPITLSFMPVMGQCATSNTLQVTVEQAIVPSVFFPAVIYCNDDPSFSLPTAIDGISGVWTGPGVVNNNFNPSTANLGANTVLFTPNNGECALGTSASFFVEICNVAPEKINARVLLEGYYNNVNGCLQSQALNTNNLIPSAQPFNTAPHNYTGTETATAIPTEASDWILLQLRSASDRNVVVAQKACFISCNGDLLDIDGSVGVVVPGLATGNYFVTILPRNHLGVMSNTAISTTDLNNNGYDFTTSMSQVYGVAQLKLVDGYYCLYAGDYDGNGNINSLDYNKWYSNNSAVNQYLMWDGNASAVVNNIDYNLWYANRSKLAVIELQF